MPGKDRKKAIFPAAVPVIESILWYSAEMWVRYFYFAGASVAALLEFNKETLKPAIFLRIRRLTEQLS
jgi:hypothetical protein